MGTKGIFRTLLALALPQLGHVLLLHLIDGLRAKRPFR
jgi:hypothetical protein